MDPQEPIDALLQESNESQQSQEQERVLTVSQQRKPINRTIIISNNITFCSDFPAGNLQTASVVSEPTSIDIYVQFKGNSDVVGQPKDKCWFYFSMQGYKIPQNGIKTVYFKWKNANNYRKFVRQKKYRPYVMIRDENLNRSGQWQAILMNSINVLEDETIQSQFSYNLTSSSFKIYVAANLPYTLQDLESSHKRIQQHLYSKAKNVYYHRQIANYSVDNFPLYLCTITSPNNVVSYQKHEPDIWLTKNGQRPHLLKNRPQIVITARVHPSQVTSSFFVQGLMESLVSEVNYQLLLQMFIFRVFPMVNPDGVQNGHYRLDNYLQNLNRFYGHSSENTPTISVAEKLIENLRQKSKLFMFFDIHGHNSPKPSFIYGNFCSNNFQTMENKAFCKILEIVNQYHFDYATSQFSKRNMSIKQKYDEHSKQASARVFAYRGNTQQDNLQTNLRNYFFVQHSYTFQVCPYFIHKSSIRRNFTKSIHNKNMEIKQLSYLQKSESIKYEPTFIQIKSYFEKQGQNLLISIMQLIGINFYYNLNEGQQSLSYRRYVYRELLKNPDFFMCDRNKKINVKEIDKQILAKYLEKWNFLEPYVAYLKRNNDIKIRSSNCPLHSFLQNNKTRKKATIGLSSLRNSQKNHVATEVQQPPPAIQMVNKQKNTQKQSESFTFVSFPKKTKTLHQEGKFQTPMRSIEFQGLGQQLVHHNTRLTHLKSNKSKSPNKKKTCYQTDIGEIQNRIRKLIFRHKTDNQILQMNQPVQEYNRVQTEVDQLKCKKMLRGNSNTKNYTQKKISYQIFNIHATKKNLVSKNINQAFNDVKLQNGQEPFKEDLQRQKYQRFQGYSQQIEAVIKKVSIRKDSKKDTIQYENQTDYKKIKSMNMMPKSNIRKQEVSRQKMIKKYQFQEKQYEFSPPKVRNISQQRSFPPLTSSSVYKDKQVYQGQKYTSNRSKFPGVHKTIKSKKRLATEIQKPSVKNSGWQPVSQALSHKQSQKSLQRSSRNSKEIGLIPKSNFFK